MEIKKPEWWRKRDPEGVDGSVRLVLRLEAVLPEPGTILDGEKWLAAVERQLREGLERAIRDLKEKGWRGEKT